MEKSWNFGKPKCRNPVIIVSPYRRQSALYCCPLLNQCYHCSVPLLKHVIKLSLLEKIVIFPKWVFNFFCVNVRDTLGTKVTTSIVFSFSNSNQYNKGVMRRSSWGCGGCVRMGSPPQYLFCCWGVLQQLFCRPHRLFIYNFSNVKMVQSDDIIPCSA